jgi:hypothetical protein
MDNDEGGENATRAVANMLSCYDGFESVKDIKHILKQGSDPAEMQNNEICLIKKEIECL